MTNAPRLSDRVGRLRQLQAVEHVMLDQLLVLAGDGAVEHASEPLGPKGAGDADIAEGDRGIGSHGFPLALVAAPPDAGQGGLAFPAGGLCRDGENVTQGEACRNSGVSYGTRR